MRLIKEIQIGNISTLYKIFALSGALLGYTPLFFHHSFGIYRFQFNFLMKCNMLRLAANWKLTEENKIRQTNPYTDRRDRGGLNSSIPYLRFRFQDKYTHICIHLETDSGWIINFNKADIYYFKV